MIWPLVALILPQTSEPNNVLLITIEDLTTQAVSSYGQTHVHTPHLDQLAEEGMQFDRAFCQAPMCNASRASFLTGLRPDSTHVYGNEDRFDHCVPDSVLSLPEILKRHGYRTIKIGKLFHIPQHTPKPLLTFDRIAYSGVPDGYEGQRLGLSKEWRQRISSLPEPAFRFSPDPEIEDRVAQLFQERERAWRGHGQHSEASRPATKAFYDAYANLFGDSGLHELQEADVKKGIIAELTLEELATSDDPWFLTVGLEQPHAPLLAPTKYLDLYELEDVPSAPAPSTEDRNVPPVAKRWGENYDCFNDSWWGERDDTTVRKARMAYYACVSLVDEQVGRILKKLEETGQEQDTVVIVVSDHGFHLGEHGMWSKYSLFDQSVRVPLWIRVPGLTDGACCGELVELVDLLPTVCSLCGVPIPVSAEGTSLTPLLAEPNRSWKKAAFCTYRTAQWDGRLIRTKRWRYSEWTPTNDVPVAYELYDLDADPWEQRNLADDPSCGETRGQLARQLKAGWRAAGPPVDQPKPR